MSKKRNIHLNCELTPSCTTFNWYVRLIEWNTLIWKLFLANQIVHYNQNWIIQATIAFLSRSLSFQKREVSLRASWYCLGRFLEIKQNCYMFQIKKKNNYIRFYECYKLISMLKYSFLCLYVYIDMFKYQRAHYFKGCYIWLN